MMKLPLVLINFLNWYLQQFCQFIPLGYDLGKPRLSLLNVNSVCSLVFSFDELKERFVLIIFPSGWLVKPLPDCIISRSPSQDLIQLFLSLNIEMDHLLQTPDLPALPTDTQHLASSRLLQPFLHLRLGLGHLWLGQTHPDKFRHIQTHSDAFG